MILKMSPRFNKVIFISCPSRKCMTTLTLYLDAQSQAHLCAHRNTGAASGKGCGRLEDLLMLFENPHYLGLTKTAFFHCLTI